MSSLAAKNYNTLIDFGKFLRENCDKLFEKDSKLSVKVDQLLILQDYLHPIGASSAILPSSSSMLKDVNKRKININSKEYILLYKSNQLHFIQDFLFKITNLKISGDTARTQNPNSIVDTVNLNIFGSLIYLEIKHWPIKNIIDLQNLRNQLEVLICIKSVNKVQDLLHFCGGDQSLPITWPKLSTLNLSYNQMQMLDSSFRLATSIETLDLSHNNLKDCGENLHHLKRLKKLNLSFNKLESIPSLCDSETISTVQFIDLSYNNIETLNIENLSKLTNVIEINLKNNLLNNIMQLNNFRLLSSIKNIIIQGNPVYLNPTSEFLIKEIINVVKLKNNLKKSSTVKTNQLGNEKSSLTNSTRLAYSQTQPTYININQKRTNALSNYQIARSAPNGSNNLYLSKTTRSSTLRQDHKKKLKPNVILIEQDNLLKEQTNENENNNANEEDLISKSVTKTLNLNETNRKFSRSVSTQNYDSNKIKMEIEMMKKMRQSYGTDWLLSTPNFNTNNESISNTTNLVKTRNKSDEKIIINKIDSEKIYIDELNNIIDSYAVYRSVRPYSGDEQKENDEELDSSIIICILSMSESYLIERDETNTEILSINKYSDLNDVKLVVKDSTSRIKISYSNSGVVKLFEFESNVELENFIGQLHKLLFSNTNIRDCELYYCSWCKEFGKKSKFKLNNNNGNHHSSESDSEEPSNFILETEDDNVNLTCTKCHKYLIKDNKILSVLKEDDIEDQNSLTNKKLINNNLVSSTPNQFKTIQEKLLDHTKTQEQISHFPTQSHTLNSTFTLKDVLKSFKTNESSKTTSTSDNTSMISEIDENNFNNNFNEKQIETPSKSLDSTAINNNNNDNNSIISNEQKEEESRLSSILDNNQLSKIKLDEINQQSRRINNNLKLYLIINVLNSDNNEIKPKISESNDDKEEETLICSYDINNIFSFKFDLTTKSLSSSTNSNNNNGLSIENCLCVFTNKNLIIFKIVNKELFDQNVEFEKCIKREISIQINKIEIIEVGMGQHYLIIESINDERNDKRMFIKFVTSDVYKTQSFFNILLKTINESKNATMLKQIKKKNELTNENLSELISNSLKAKSDLSSLNFYAFLTDLLINDISLNQMFESNSKNLFVYNDEKLFLIEENLSYFNQKTNIKSNHLDQFCLIQIANISDIVHLKLFKECETKIEISFVDESNNSKHVKWTFDLNKQFLLSQFINQLKTVWEKIFFVELPINF